MARNTVTTRTRLFTSGSDYAAIGLVLVVATAGALAWITGQLSALLFRATWPATPVADALTIALAVPRHWDDPRQAWPPAVRGDLPGPVGFYSTALLLVLMLAALIVVGIRVNARGRSERGFATRAQLAVKLSRQAALAEAGRLRPDLPAEQVQIGDVAVDLGRAHPSGMPLVAQIDNSVAVFSAPRIGKSSQVIIPWLTDWPGPAVVTSIRGEIIEATLPLREQRGPVAILDLAEENWPHRLRWSHLTGCDRYHKARSRASLLVRVGKPDADDSTNAGFFGMSAVNLLAGWMHTAAVTGRTMEDVLRWGLREGDDEPLTLLAGNSTVHPYVAGMLEGIYAAEANVRGNMWSTVMTALAPLTSPVALHAFCPPAAESFDIEDFLRRSGTVYITVAEEDATDLAPLIAGFVDEIAIVARRLADRSPSGRLNPPLSLLLDEVANVVPLPRLPKLMSYAGGSGIFAVAVFQSIAQARERWGRDGAEALWGAATIKLALGGLSGDEPEALSRLAGKYRETVLSVAHGPHGHTITPSLVDRLTITPDEIRTLSPKRHEALVIHATTPAVITRMRPHYRGPHAQEHATAVEATRAIRLGQEAKPS